MIHCFLKLEYKLSQMNHALGGSTLSLDYPCGLINCFWNVFLLRLSLLPNYTIFFPVKLIQCFFCCLHATRKYSWRYQIQNSAFIFNCIWMYCLILGMQLPQHDMTFFFFSFFLNANTFIVLVTVNIQDYSLY